MSASDAAPPDAPDFEGDDSEDETDSADEAAGEGAPDGDALALSGRPAVGAEVAGAAVTVAGTVAIVGRPNVGKSTLLNRILGQKLAIVSDRPQTTRNRIVGVWTGAITTSRVATERVAGQIAFVDTPGVHDARSALNKFMVGEALGALADVDAVLLVVEADGNPGSGALPAGARRIHPADARLLEELRSAGKPTILAINKVDKIRDKRALLPLLEGWGTRGDFAALVPISATRGVGVVDVVRELLKLLPAGGPIYDPETLTDRSERFLAAELIREQLFLRLRQEIPYETGVVVDNWGERSDAGDVVIDATILVGQESQKAIVVGKGGAMVRDVGTSARAEISNLVGRPVHLRLHVKVAPDWTSSEAGIARLGYRKGE
jgi:GTP-binding protein Era